VADEKTIDDAVMALNLSLQSPATPMAAIQKAAKRLADLVFANAPIGAAPKSLWVMSDDLLTRVPISLLPWPGSDVPLLETSAVSVMTRIRVKPSGSSREPISSTSNTAIQVFTAPDLSAAGFAPLPMAHQEHKWIESAAQTRKILNFAAASVTPEAVTRALATPQSWLHIASHGVADTAAIGYAGVWLAPKAGETRPQLLSALALAEQPLAADLAVLNACQLASNSLDSSESSMSFATAVSAAGVRHVVAALWPISDGSTRIWVPEFYAHLQHADDTEWALASAQRALAHHEAFRHPYYWASLVHFVSPEIGTAEVDGIAAP
jgi:CHAT domain-containing protein